MERLPKIKLIFDLKLMFRGGLLAARNAFIGILIFAILEIMFTFGIRFVIDFTVEDLEFILFPIPGLIYMIWIANLFTLPPAIIFGCLLAIELNRNYLNKNLSNKSAIIKGAILGLIVGIGISSIIAISRIWHHFSKDVLYLDAFTATIIATIAGGWTGKQISNLILNTKPTSP